LNRGYFEIDLEKEIRCDSILSKISKKDFLNLRLNNLYIFEK